MDLHEKASLPQVQKCCAAAASQEPPHGQARPPEGQRQPWLHCVCWGPGSRQEGHIWGPGQNIDSANQIVIFQITSISAERSAAHGCKHHLIVPWDHLHQDETNTFSDQVRFLHGV